MKRIAVILLLLSACSIYSQTYYLNIYSKGQVTSVPVQDIRKLTFAGIANAIETGKVKTIITNFELFQNYPNPFNPTTKIEYQIPDAGNIEVRVYNINGQLVKTLVSQSQSAGKYSVEWDGKDNNLVPAASGIYICRVMYGSSVLSKKMMLLK